jgi:predicted DsbA family dithiol-disulfide isomerase
LNHPRRLAPVAAMTALRSHPLTTVPITYFSDMLCVWAYIAQLRVDALKAAFGASARNISITWRDKGGYEGFNAHLRHVAEQFPEIPVSPELWLTVRPRSSTSPHLFLKAVRLLERADQCPAGTAEDVTWALRRAFFESARYTGRWDVQRAVAEEAGLDLETIENLIRDGSAYAAMASDLQDAEAMHIHGSPSFVLNEGRQTLYGNVGYRVLEANIQEPLRAPSSDQASWC